MNLVLERKVYKSENNPRISKKEVFMVQRVRQGDISNRTVLTVLVVVILVSVVSLALYLRALDDAVPIVTYGANGQVSLTIDQPVQSDPANVVDTGSAKVGISI